MPRQLAFSESGRMLTLTRCSECQWGTSAAIPNSQSKAATTILKLWLLVGGIQDGSLETRSATNGLTFVATPAAM